jgi:hypothetical protein
VRAIARRLGPHARTGVNAEGGLQTRGQETGALVCQLLLSLVPSALAQGMRVAVQEPFSWAGLVTLWACSVCMLTLVSWARPRCLERTVSEWPWGAVGTAALGVVAGATYGATGGTVLAWLTLGTFWSVLLWMDTAMETARPWLYRWLVRGLLVAMAGALPTVLTQVESRFSDEEFLVAIQALQLAVIWTALLVVYRLGWPPQGGRGQGGLRVDLRLLVAILVTASVVGTAVTIREYQRSFYPAEVPLYEGTSAEGPFLCSQIPASELTVDGKQVFKRLLSLVEANPSKQAPEYGMLALGTREARWAQAFRTSLLQEANQGLFTGPANSVKFAQYEAALRVYYYPRVLAAFPGLFSPADESLLRDWFAAVNRRALTVEWVDWMYALAFARWPEGPYENQENGAGLLALLEVNRLAPADLGATNRDYLARHASGWVARFRNTDDSLSYQPEWINNAFFQSLYTGESSSGNVRRSFEWLLTQALPDGGPLGYNQPARHSLAGIYYLGARLLMDPRYLWLADRALSQAERQGDHIGAQPGAEDAVELVGRSPDTGSCLLYGDSGLPTQVGPLAPDKIVFRDGWAESATYLLLNLRFTGWHRYKATNTLTLLYQGTPLVQDVTEGKSFAWLPVGRSLFRDKRIPRENLNGLVVERAGMSAVLYELTGMGGPWAQDPPYYARVEQSETGSEMDRTTTVLDDWRGWTHRRTVYFYHGGPIVVVDSAAGPIGQRAALTWHVLGDSAGAGTPIRLRGGVSPVEMLLLSTDLGEVDRGRIATVPESYGGSSGLGVTYYAAAGGRLGMVTLFLPGDWVGALASIVRENDRPVLHIEQGEQRIILPLSL